ERPAASRDVGGDQGEVIEALAAPCQPARDGVAHVRTVERLHELDAHLPGLAGEREEETANALDVEAGLGELLEPESVPPDAKRRVEVADDDADVAAALEH